MQLPRGKWVMSICGMAYCLLVLASPQDPRTAGADQKSSRDIMTVTVI